MDWGNFTWLSAFESDAMRLAAILVVGACAVVIALGRPFIKAWQMDRANQREIEVRKQELLSRIEALSTGIHGDSDV